MQKKETKLTDIVEIFLGVQKKSIESEKGEELIVLSPKDIHTSGVIDTTLQPMKVDTSKIKKELFLKEYDILLLRHGKPFKVALIEDVNKPMVASDAFFVLRIKNKENLKEDAITLYMYLKSNKGQNELANIAQDATMPTLNKKSLEDFTIPFFDDKLLIICNYKDEKRLYSEITQKQREIAKIHTYFDNE